MSLFAPTAMWMGFAYKTHQEDGNMRQTKLNNNNNDMIRSCKDTYEDVSAMILLSIFLIFVKQIENMWVFSSVFHSFNKPTPQTQYTYLSSSFTRSYVNLFFVYFSFSSFCIFLEEKKRFLRFPSFRFFQILLLLVFTPSPRHISLLCKTMLCVIIC